ncbi:MAG: outer membrane beta-barrel protein [Pseudomonadota bacterium]
MSVLRRSFGLSAAIAALSVLPTVAASQSYDWEGFYAGATLGGALYSAEASELTDQITNDSPSIETFVPSYGISAHYNWVPFDDNLVLGAELDITFGLLNEDFISTNAAGDTGFNYENSWDSVISLRARAGVTNGNLHSFIAGGPAFANAKFTTSIVDPGQENQECGVPMGLTCAEVDETLTGVSVGAGMEYAFREDWIAKFEIMHFAMPSVSAPLTDSGNPLCDGVNDEECIVSYSSSATEFRFGFSYKF